MFAPTFFPPTFFPPTFFPPGLGEVLLEGRTPGGNSFLVFKPILDQIKTELPINTDQNIVSYHQLSDTEFEIDGKKYGLVPQRTPEEVIKGINDVEKIIAEAAAEAGISNDLAREELYNQVLKELKQVEELKNSVFNDDEEIIMILIATDAV